MKKITILTQHLLCNYGGFLQNFALQQILGKMGYDVVTIDYLRTMNSSPLWRCVLSWCKTLLLCFLGKHRKFIQYSSRGERKEWAEDFVKKWIKTTPKCYKYKPELLKDSDAVIVGSDQVWRPKYNHKIEDLFLQFAEKLPIKRIAYAASFGVDEWEFPPEKTRICSMLVKKFDAISVREESGLSLCKEHLGVDATWVLDPTFLLTKDDYLAVCKNIPKIKEKILVAYVLDLNPSIREECELMAKELNLYLRLVQASSNASLTVPEWLAMFRDASYVVTDSFHGTVFSIIFGKEFKCLYNQDRGAARFESLLKLYNSGKLEEMRRFSLNWLKNALEK